MSGNLVYRGIALLLVCVLGLAIGVGTANAIILDHFSGISSPSTSGSTPAPDQFIVGGNDWQINYQSGGSVTGIVSDFASVSGMPSNFNRVVTISGTGVVTTSQNLSATMNIGPTDSVTFHAGSQVPGSLSLNYTAASGVLNLAGASNINIDVDYADHTTSGTLTLEDSSSNSHTEPFTIALNTTTSQVISVALSLFSAAGVDLSNIVQYQFGFNNGDGLDLIISAIDAPEIPEPIAICIWALTGIGGLGMVRVCRNRRESAAV